MADILVPIFICVVLPVSIVLIIYLASVNNDNKRAEVLMKAIESGRDVDVDRLAEALGRQQSKKNHKTTQEMMNSRLLKGCMFSLTGLTSVIIGLCEITSLETFNLIPSGLGALLLSIGLSYLIVYFVSRKQMLKEDSSKK